MIALLTLAVAAHPAPLADAHWYGSLGDEAPGLGAGLGVAVPVGPIHLEGAVDVGGVGPVGVEGHGFALLRWYPAGPSVPAAPSLRVGPGIRVAEGGVAPEGMLGAALDLPSLGAVRPRVSLDGLVRPGPVFTGRLTLGLVVGNPVVRRGGGPIPGEGPALFEDPTGQALVWLPHPVCQWVPAGEVETWVGLVPPGQSLRVRAPGYVPVDAPASGLADVTLEPAPEHGSVIVVASPGDRVRLGSDEFTAPADGVVVLDLPVGLAPVEVIGGGRVQTLEAAVADGYALWLRPAPPAPVRITFPPAKATLDAAARATIATLVANAGGASFALRGSHSPEGDAGDNDRLATQRARVVSEALIAAGLDPVRVLVEPAVAPDPALPAEAQRAVVVTPVVREVP